MANEENLIPYKKGEISTETAKRNGAKGGRATKRNRDMRKLAEMMFTAPALLPEEVKAQIRIMLGANDDDTVTNQMLYLSKLGAILGGKKTTTRDYLAALEKAMDLAGTNAQTVIARERMKLEKERIKLERERIELEREKMQYSRGISEDVPAPVLIDDIPREGGDGDG